MDKGSKMEKDAFGCAKTGILLFSMAAVMNIMLGFQTETVYAHGALKGIAEPLPGLVFYAAAYLVLFMLVGFLSSECCRWLYASRWFHEAGMLALLASAFRLLAVFLLEYLRLSGDVPSMTPELIRNASEWSDRSYAVLTGLAFLMALVVTPVTEFMKRD